MAKMQSLHPTTVGNNSTGEPRCLESVNVLPPRTRPVKSGAGPPVATLPGKSAKLATETVGFGPTVGGRISTVGTTVGTAVGSGVRGGRVGDGTAGTGG